MKKIRVILTYILVTAALLTALAGCGSDSGITYALVTGSAGLTGNKAASMAWNGEQNFAMAGGTSAGRYQAASQSEEDLESAIKTAVDAGATTIVCVGSDLEKAVYTAQNRYKKVRFIMLDGQPRPAEGEEPSIAENTISVTFNTAQIGYLAGYAAVRDGMRHLSFMTGSQAENVRRYETGLIKGAVDAASELGLGLTDVIVDLVVLDSDKLSPLVMQKAMDLYDSGSELIMAYGDAIQQAVIKAAEVRDKDVATAGADLRSYSNRVIMGALSDSGQAVEAALLACGREDFVGGTLEKYGAAENSVELGIAYDRLTGFSENDYRQIYEGLAGGSRIIPEEDMTTGSDQVEVIVH